MSHESATLTPRRSQSRKVAALKSFPTNRAPRNVVLSVSSATSPSVPDRRGGRHDVRQMLNRELCDTL